MFKRYLAPLFVAVSMGIAACSQASAPTAEPSAAAKAQTELPLKIEAAKDARLAAVLIYADWCGSCKKLDPKIKAAKARNDFAGTSFITLDYTDRDREAVFHAADVAGVGAPIRTFFADEMTTGLLLLVDLDDQTIVGDLRKELSDAEIEAAIVNAAAAA